VAKGGPLSFILPALGGLAAIGTLGAALPAVIGGEAALGAGELGATAGLDLGGEAALGAGELGSDFIGGGLGGELASTGGLLGSDFAGGAGAAEALTAGGAAGGGLEAAGGIASGLGGLATAGEALSPLTTAGDAGLSATAGLPLDAAGTPVANIGLITDPSAAGVAAAGPGTPSLSGDVLSQMAQTGVEPTTGGGIDAVAGTATTPQVAVGGGGEAVDAAMAPVGGGGIGGAFDTVGETLGSPGFKGLTSLASLGLLGSQLLSPAQQYPEQKALNKQAAGYSALGSQLASPITTGALPSGARSWVDSATEAAKASARTGYAGAGLSGSTMEHQALGAIDERAAGQQFNIANDLLKSSLGYSTLGSNLTESSLKTSIAQDKDYREALYNFSKALAGTNVT